MSSFFYSQKFLNYIIYKKINAKYIYSKYLIRSIDINSFKFFYLDNYSNIYIKYLNTDYSLLWTQKLMSVGSSYIGKPTTYQFYTNNLENLIYINWKKVNFNYASFLIKQCYSFITDKNDFLFNCLVLKMKKGGFWCLSKNILLFVKNKNIKKIYHNYNFNKFFNIFKKKFNNKIYFKSLIKSIKNINIYKIIKLFYTRINIQSSNNSFLKIIQSLKFKEFILYLINKNIQLSLFLRIIDIYSYLSKTLKSSTRLFNHYIFIHTQKKKIIIM